MKTVKYLLAFFFVFLAVSITGCSHLAKTSAEKAIKKDLDLLKNLDSETTMKYISYQELFPDSDDNTELSDDIKEVFSSSSRILITKYWIYPLTRIRKLLLHTCGLPLWIPRRLRKISLPRALKMKS